MSVSVTPLRFQPPCRFDRVLCQMPGFMDRRRGGGLASAQRHWVSAALSCARNHDHTHQTLWPGFDSLWVHRGSLPASSFCSRTAMRFSRCSIGLILIASFKAANVRHTRVVHFACFVDCMFTLIGTSILTALTYV